MMAGYQMNKISRIFFKKNHVKKIKGFIPFNGEL